MISVHEDKNSAYLNSKVFFDIHGMNITLTDNDADVYISDKFNIPKNVKCKSHLILNIYHNYESLSLDASNKLSWYPDYNVSWITNVIDFTINDPRILFFDICFNRTKAFYTKLEFNNIENWWYYAGHDCYVLNKIDFEKPRSRVYLAVNNTYRKYVHIRPFIINYLNKQNVYKINGFIGDGNNPILRLKPEGTDIFGSNYIPVANDFYSNSYISIYGETLEFGNSQSVTEKTFEPLIKGHFILPFSTPNFIDLVKSYGFKFPTFINYEYDSVLDYRDRSKLFFEEMERLINLPLSKWHELYVENADIITHNRQVFYNKPYHKLNLQSLLQL